MTVTASQQSFMTLSVVSAEYAFWDVTSDASIFGAPYVAIVPAYGFPDAQTTWYEAAWEGLEVVSGGVHMRTIRALLAGPDNGVNPSGPLVVPAGEWDTWIRFDADPERIVRAIGRVIVEGVGGVQAPPAG